MGHVHYVVPRVDVTARFWETLGGTRSALADGDGQLVRFPGIAVLLTAGELRENSQEAIVGHIAFRVESVADIEARGIDVQYNEQYPGVVYVHTPDGERVELFDDGIATNIGFDPDTGAGDATALRHNAPLTAPIVSHHMHLYVPPGDVDAAQRWYVENFGAVPGVRWRYAAADLPGINLNFSESDIERAPTAGRMLDHIGFEVVALERFVAALRNNGVAFDEPYRVLDSGIATAVLTDPWGTRIELTEGMHVTR